MMFDFNSPTSFIISSIIVFVIVFGICILRQRKTLKESRERKLPAALEEDIRKLESELEKVQKDIEDKQESIRRIEVSLRSSRSKESILKSIEEQKGNLERCNSYLKEVESHNGYTELINTYWDLAEQCQIFYKELRDLSRNANYFEGTERLESSEKSTFIVEQCKAGLTVLEAYGKYAKIRNDISGYLRS